MAAARFEPDVFAIERAPMKMNKRSRSIFIGLMLGVVTGYLCNTMAPDAVAATEIAGYFAVLTDIFLRLVKMIIAPLVFSTLVAGIASLGDTRAMVWFLTASLLSLFLGLFWGNLLQPGHGIQFSLPDSGAATSLKPASLKFEDFIVNVFPRSILEAMGTNAVLQIVVFSLFFGFALSSLKDGTGKLMICTIDGLKRVMIRITDYVMLFAPVGVFSAVAGVVTVQSLGVFSTYSALIGCFYLGLASLWLVLLGVGYFVLKERVFTLMRLIKEPAIIAFSTASSEAAFPKTIEQLEKFGVRYEVSGFVLPMGYAFNLGGSMMYMTFAMVFIAQAYGIELSLFAQLTMLLVLMVSSKGMAGVPHASLVVIATTLPMFGLPEAGLLLIMGIDVFLDMGRTATNVIGNSLATAVIAKREGRLGPTASDGDEGAAQRPKGLAVQDRAAEVMRV
jgi:Na+/H+-dicarboxylate symporter